MKILVTGANGYLGQGVVKALADMGADVIACDFSCDNVVEAQNIEKVEIDLFGLEKPYDYFGQPDAVLHMAWRDGFKHSSPNHMKDLPKHLDFIASLVESGIKQVTVLGSMHEVGFYEGSISENAPTNPLSLYGIAKNSLRQAVELLTKDYDFVYQWVRGYYIVGNTQYGCSIFSKITEAVSKGEKHFPFTSGQNQYDFIDYEIFCKQVAAVVCQQDVVGIINCCSGRPMKLADRVEQFIKDNNYDIVLDYGTFPDRPYDSKAVWGDETKINQIMAKYGINQ